MSNHASQGGAPSLVLVLKLLSREWKAVRKMGDDPEAGAEWGKKYFGLPIWTLARLIEESTSFPRPDIERAVYYIDRPLERTPAKQPGYFIPPDLAIDVLGLPENFATGADLQNLRSLREELNQCDTDGRTAEFLTELEVKHPGVLAAVDRSYQRNPPANAESLSAQTPPLASSIDELLAFVREQRPPKFFDLRGELLNQFHELDRAVWVKVCLLKLEDKLPKCLADGKSLGKTHVPGVMIPGAFRVHGITNWRLEMLALCDLAKAQTTKMVLQADQAEPPAELKTTERKIDPPDPFNELGEFATAKLKGIERRIVELICEHGGSCPLAQLAIDPAIKWPMPCDDAFNSAKKRINAKLKKTQWNLYRHDGKAKVKHLGRK